MCFGVVVVVVDFAVDVVVVVVVVVDVCVVVVVGLVVVVGFPSTLLLFKRYAHSADPCSEC